MLLLMLLVFPVVDVVVIGGGGGGGFVRTDRTRAGRITRRTLHHPIVHKVYPLLVAKRT